MSVETGLPVSLKLFGTGFDLLVKKYKTTFSITRNEANSNDNNF